MTNDLRLISEAQAAERLGIDRSTLCRLRSKKAIAFFQIGGRVLFNEEHLAEFLKSVEQKPAEPGSLEPIETRKRTNAQ